MANETKDNIEKKRKNLRRRRRIKAFRLVFALVILCLIGSAILFVGYSVYNAGVRVYNEFAELYPDCDIDIQYGGQPLYYYLIAVE